MMFPGLLPNHMHPLQVELELAIKPIGRLNIFSRKGDLRVPAYYANQK